MRVVGVSVTLLLAGGCGGNGSGLIATTELELAPSTSLAATTLATTTTEGPVELEIELLREEVRFRSGEFQLVGELSLPGGNGPYRAIVLIHSSGSQTRTSTPTSGLIRQRFLDAGYAVLAWDKPGSGESTGELDGEYETTQLASILADGVALLVEHPSIDSDHIGLWGLSQAGWVMPMALTMTNDVAFMIVVNGGGEDAIENQVYQWGRKAICLGGTEEETALIEEHGAPALKAATYEEYRDAMEVLLTIPKLSTYVGVQVEMAAEHNWVPWPREIDAFFDPIEVIGTTTIPILAIFAELDVQVDPVQGAAAYGAALERAGNAESHVEIISGVGHTLNEAEQNGCATGSGHSTRYLELIDEWIERPESL